MKFEYISISEWCKLVGMPRKTAMNYIERGLLNAKNVSGRWIIDKQTPRPPKVQWGSNRNEIIDLPWKKQV